MARHCAAARLRCGAAVAAAAVFVACSDDHPEPAAPPMGETPATTATAPRTANGKAATDEDVPGRWRKLRPSRSDPELSAAQREEIARLEAIGYLAGSSPAPDLRGVTLHDRARAWQGANFYTSGHAPEAVLMDMDGRVLHRWRRAFGDVWPDFPEQWLHVNAGFFRRAHLFPNGDILAIFEGLGLIKLDRDSRLLWSSPIQAHHDLAVAPDGDIYVLAREAKLAPEIDPEHPVLLDFIAQLAPDGSEKRRIPILDALRRSRYASILAATPVGVKDLFHTNTLALLDGRFADRLPPFRRGNALVSLRVQNAIGVVDLERSEFVWALQGGFRSQHDPKLLANGRILLFDNLGPDASKSRVLEIDPGTGKIAWQYAGTAERPFFSRTCGAAERLPNGNTLVTESDQGRAFEVTRNGEVVWEFYNPHRAGEHGELIATLFEMVRLPPEFPAGWTGSEEELP